MKKKKMQQKNEKEESGDLSKEEPKWTISELIQGKHTEWINKEYDGELRKVCPSVASWKEREGNRNAYPICYGRVGCRINERCPLLFGLPYEENLG
jgi:hypothetical protein